MTLDDASVADAPSASSSAPPSVGTAVGGPATATRARDRAVVLLAALSGATDAVGLLALGGSFTSVMTGNMVFLGVAVGTHTAALGFTLTAIGAYAAGVLGGAAIVGEPRPGDGVWHPHVTRGLLVETACLAAFATAWWCSGSHPPRDLLAPLLAANAAALGVQSAVILRFGVSGLSTTYMTGTLTTMLARIAGRHPLASVGRAAALLAGLIAGAAAGGLAYDRARPLVPALQLGLVLGAVALGARAQRAEREAR